MEIFLWIVLYLAFILPVTKISIMESRRGFEHLDFEVSEYLIFGFMWPLAFISLPGCALLDFIIVPICKKLASLIED